MGDLPDPPEDNFIYVDQGLTDTGDEIFYDRDRSALPIDSIYD
jgi:hypothetical protein